jgi:dUTP pyrophosphatase
MIWTDIKVDMGEGFVLKIYPKSGLATKRGLVLKNTIGVVDADYYGNPANDGNIGIMLWNTSGSLQEIQIGEKIAQGIFERYYIVDNDGADGDRMGGFGSTGK